MQAAGCKIRNVQCSCTRQSAACPNPGATPPQAPMQHAQARGCSAEIAARGMRRCSRKEKSGFGVWLEARLAWAAFSRTRLRAECGYTRNTRAVAALVRVRPATPQHNRQQGCTTKDAGKFPRVGNRMSQFFQALEKLVVKPSKPWQSDAHFFQGLIMRQEWGVEQRGLHT